MRSNHRKLLPSSFRSFRILYDLTPPPAVPPPDSSADDDDGHSSASYQKGHPIVTPKMMIIAFGVMTVVFLTTFFTVLYRRRKDSARRRSELVVRDRQDFIDENQGPEIDHPIWYINTIGLDRSVIDSISVFKYKKDEPLIDGTECSVCLSEFEDNENLKLLPKCSHAFHVPCIDTWLRAHKTCPVCRAPVVCAPAAVQATTSELNVSDLTSRNEIGAGEGSSSSHSSTQDFNFAVEEMASEVENSILSDSGVVLRNFVENDHVLVESQEPVRRSVSLDPSSANAMAGGVCEKDQESLDLELGKTRNSRVKNCPNRSSGSLRFNSLMKSSSVGGCSMQKSPIAMKRSFSFFH